MSYHKNGAVVVPYNGRVSRQVALLDRICFASDADVRSKERADKDELEVGRLAEKVSESQRALEKYQAGLIAIADLVRRLEDENLAAAETAIMHQLVEEHQKVMAAAITEFCGDGVNATKIVAKDVDRLRESITDRGNSRRSRKVAKPGGDFSVQED